MNLSAKLLHRLPVLLATLASLGFLHAGPLHDTRGRGAPTDAPHLRQTRWIAGKQPQKPAEVQPPETRDGNQGRKTPVPAAAGGGKAAPQAPPKPFTPSEKIKPGQAVDFPTDI